MAQEVGGAVNHQASPITPDNILRRLRQSTLFRNLSDEEFRDVVALLRIQFLEEGETLLVAGKDNYNLYILRRGNLLIRAPEKKGKDPIIRLISPGEILNELPFVTGHPSEVTIEAATRAQLWYIQRDEFQALLEKKRHIRERLAYTPDEEKYMQPRRFESQRPGEVILWFGRRHPWAFLQKQWLTMLTLVFAGAIFFLTDRLAWGSTGQIVGFILLGVALVIFLWLLIDWWNDYYVVTDQRVIHRERIMLIRDFQNELPITSVQKVTVTRANLISIMLDVGSLTIETSGARANVEFDWVSQPDAVSKIILDQQARARREVAAIERSKVRDEMRREMGLGKPPPPESDEEEGTKKKPPLLHRLRSGLANLRNELPPRARLVRPPDTIVYRKHWLALIRTISAPLLAFLTYAAGLIFIWLSVASLRRLLFETPAIIVTAALGLILFSWLIWQYEDWRNDLYMLTKDRLIDYKRTPFGLRGTSERTASLDNVQNVSAVTKGFIDNLFNVGDVTIRTGGVDNELNFVRVWNPRGVQREIVERLEAYRAEQREKEAARRRREFIEWIGIYDELTRIHRPRPII